MDAYNYFYMHVLQCKIASCR